MCLYQSSFLYDPYAIIYLLSGLNNKATVNNRPSFKLQSTKDFCCSKTPNQTATPQVYYYSSSGFLVLVSCHLSNYSYL